MRARVGLLAVGLLAASAAMAGQPRTAAPPPPAEDAFASVRLAIADLMQTFGPQYPDGAKHLARLAALEKDAGRSAADRQQELGRLQADALLANPLLDFSRLLVVKRRCRNPKDPGFPTNHECNASLPRTGYENEIAVLSPVGPGGRMETLYRPQDGGWVGEMDLHWDAQRLLFTRSDAVNWKVCEVRTDGAGLRQVSRMPDDVDAFDPCYLPDGRIVFGSTASYQSVPCWHGQKRVSNLYLMEADGSGVRQLCFDQDHDFHPCVLADGQVIYHRWDYTGIAHVFLRELMVMNPDGTGQRAVYGSNSWFPNALYFPQPIPGLPDRLVCILSGYHGVPRMGRLVLLDTARGWYTADGIVHEIPRRGRPIQVAVRDNLVDDDWPKFLHPWPLGDPDRPETCGKYFLVACWPQEKRGWGIYLADVFDNLVLLHEEPGCALLEPVPIRRRPVPPAVPDRVDLARADGVVYLHNLYAGPGLAGVPRGTVKRLRIVAYDFGYRGLGGPDKVGYGGPWEVMRILGTVPVDADGSALFRVPANTPVAVQALDAEGKAVQLMRSWMTLMPGETQSCVGCHERTGDVAGPQLAAALERPPADLRPWHGPARGFDFAREVQPVLDRHCAGCHDGSHAGRPDLRPAEAVKDYAGRRISDLGVNRLHPEMRKATGGVLKYTPAYDALIPYIRRVGIEDDVSLLVPGEYHADTSPLVQMLRKGHQGVRLDAEAWDRLVTWIDLNGPCHGTWSEVYPIPDAAHERRLALRRLYSGPAEDPEIIPPLPRPAAGRVEPQPLPDAGDAQAAGWPFGPQAARQRQAAAGPTEKIVDLGDGVAMKLVRVPAGEFVMGDAAGQPDERPVARVVIARPFWMGACEVTNAQFRRFDSSHDPRYYAKRHARADDQGLPLDGPDQPAVRVSWEEAMAFCRWLSERTATAFTLPTEAQWEYACRAGAAAPLAFGGVETDFSRWANVADMAFGTGRQATGGVEHLVREGAALADLRFDDGAVVTASAGRYRPNAWGLFDMHGNAAEWTRTAYRPYPYRADDGRNAATPVGRDAGTPVGRDAGTPVGRDAGTGDGRKVVRGGSFFDPPGRCRSAFRLAYPPWQRVFNVGFRVISEAPATAQAAAGP